MALGLRTRRFLSYSADWLVAILIDVFAEFYLQKFQQIPSFDLTDTSIQYTFRDQTIPKGPLILLLGLPYALVVIAHFCFSFRRWWDLHSTLLALTICYSLSGTLSQIVRISAGRPRPDFISRCNPSLDAHNAPVFGLVNITICQQTDFEFLQDGMRSFFSGHAILAAAGFGFTSLYLAGKMQVFVRSAYTYKLWLIASPMILAIWVCMTRIADRRHHWQDVATGFFLGLLIAYAIYRQFFPYLGDPECHLCYPPRFEDEYKRRETIRQQDERAWVPLSGKELVIEVINNPDDLFLGLETTPFQPEDRTAVRQRYDNAV